MEEVEGETIFINDERWPEDHQLTGEEQVQIARYMEFLIKDMDDLEFQHILKKFWKKYNIEYYHARTRGLWCIGENLDQPEKPFRLEF